jgi:hypothetical protein
MRMRLGAVNPYLNDPQWLAFAKQNVGYAASQGCVFDYLNNVECCLGTAKGGPDRAKTIVAEGASAIADAARNCGQYQTAASIPAATPATPVTTVQIHQLSPSAPQPPVPRITAQNLARPLPDIGKALAPVPLPCSAWSQLNGWISDHPVIATAILVGTAVFFARKHG